MKKLMIIGLTVLLAGVATDSRADIVTNLLSDPGFENLVGFEPNTNTAPWGAIEPSTFPVASVAGANVTKNFHSGTNAVVFQYYSISPTARLYQDTGVLVEAGKDYEMSVWALLGDKSASAANSNSTTFNLAVYTSTTVDGTYAYRTGSFNNIPSIADTWEQFSATVTATQLSAYVGEYMRFVITRPNSNVEYRLFLDDASFGAVAVPEPATIGMLGLGALVALGIRRMRK